MEQCTAWIGFARQLLVRRLLAIGWQPLVWWKICGGRWWAELLSGITITKGLLLQLLLL